MSPSVEGPVAPLPQFPAPRQRGREHRNVQGPEVSAAGSWAGAGPGGRAARGPSKGIAGVGGLAGWGVVGGREWRTKRRHHPAARANGMNGL